MLKITLAWTDSAASLNNNKALINDLDLELDLKLKGLGTDKLHVGCSDLAANFATKTKNTKTNWPVMLMRVLYALPQRELFTQQLPLVVSQTKKGEHTQYQSYTIQ